MPYFKLRDGKTTVEAIGQAATKKEGTYYASWAGPAQAAKAVWAAAVGSAKTSTVISTWDYTSRMVRPTAKAVVVKLRNSNYVHYVLRSADPLFILVTDPVMGKLYDYRGYQITPYGSNEQTQAYRAIKALLPEWEMNASESRTTYTTKVIDWYASQPRFQAELAHKLVNALNQGTKVPVLPEWGPTLLARLPYDAYDDNLNTYGDAVAALKLKPEFAWADWIGDLLKQGAITIPNPEGE